MRNSLGESKQNCCTRVLELLCARTQMTFAVKKIKKKVKKKEKQKIVREKVISCKLRTKTRSLPIELKRSMRRNAGLE